MISEFFLNIVFILLNGFFSILPDFSWSVDSTMFVTFLDVVKAGSYLLPIGTVINILALFVALMVVRIVVRLIITIWELMPFV